MKLNIRKGDGSALSFYILLVAQFCLDQMYIYLFVSRQYWG
jgi:hypothetical protein